MLAAYAVARLVSAIPITPGGVGLVELGLVGGLIAVGGPHAGVVAGVLVFRVLSFFLPLPFGLATYVVWRRERRWRRPAGAAPGSRRRATRPGRRALRTRRPVPGIGVWKAAPMRIGLFISDVSGARTGVDELLENAAHGGSAGFQHGLGSPRPVEPRRPHRARARRPGHEPHRARHRGDAHVSASPVGDGATGDVDPGRDRRAARPRGRAVTSGCHREDVRPRVRPSGAAHPGVRRGAARRVRGNRQRRVPRRLLRLLVDARRAGVDARADHDRRARSPDAAARGRAHRRHHHLLGQRTRVGEHIVPRITVGAESAGRPAPRVVVGIPVGVCDDAAAGHDQAARLFEPYLSIPTYQRVLARGRRREPDRRRRHRHRSRGGRSSPAYADAGATDLCVAVLGLGPDRDVAERRTIELLASLGDPN